ncbi:hypothetical protein AGMMS49574_24980 [Bacteroidia bacterium]|nr:hypothetical protein AGMMS49574_24980 [Bacteroidia bacterium]
MINFMNRKIFTLTAGALMLAASLGSASAQVTAGTDITTLKKSVSGKYLYQLGVTVGTPGAVAPTHLLTADKDGGLSLETVGAASYSNAYGQSLWCVAFGNYVASGDYHVGLDVTNKASQKSLLVAVEDSYAAAADSINVSFGSEGTWGFSANYENSIEQGKPLYSYFTEDSVVFMIQDATSYVDAKSLAVARMSASDFFTAVGTGTGWDKAKSTAFATIAQANVLFFHIQEPAHLILNANDFNTLLNTKPEGFQKLTFTVDKNNVSFENPWSDHALKAFDANKGSTAIVDATGTAVAGNLYKLPNAQPWVYFALEKGITNARPDDKFLRVDTAYSASFSSHLVFNYGKNPTAEVSAGVFQPIQGQYYFRLTYNVSKDSLGIDVAEARYLQKVGPQYTPNWIDILSTAGSPSFLKWEAYQYSSTQWWISHPDNITYPFTAGDKLHVALVDLDKTLGSRLITIGAPTVNTYAQLNMGGCNASVDFESIPEGLYVIKNTAGQALGVPIYTDSLAVGSVNSPLWTTLSQQEPNYLPSYQWVVKHTRSSELSPLSIKNREFPNISFTNVQLKKEGIVFAGSVKADITKGSFTLVPAEISNNEYLGYLHIEEKDAKLNTYDLNYLHAYNKTQYLGVGDKNAAVVKENPTQFKFIPVAAAAVNYGYKTAKVSGKWPLNIAQLKRTAYTLTQNNKVLTIDAEKRFVYANQPAANENGLTDNGVFLIRTYNTIVTEGVPTHYYALLDTNSFVGRHDVYNYAGNADYSDGVTPLHIGYVKVGIADGNVCSTKVMTTGIFEDHIEFQ